jgi:hypothetical protein
MSGLHLVGSGVIFRNPDPGYRHVAAMFPHPLELPSGELICTYNRGSAMYATDLAFHLARSADEGYTWNDSGPIDLGARDSRPYSYHDPFLTCTRNGMLLIGAFRTDRSDPQRPMFNEQTGGLTSVEVFLIRSSDGGHSWGAVEPLALPQGIVATPAGPIVELCDGSWLWPCDQWNAFDDQRPYQPRTLGFFSRDQGRSWGDIVAFADGAAAGQGFWHGKPIVLADGRLQTMYWAADMRSGANLPNHVCSGDPSAHHWDVPMPTNLPGQTSALVDLGGQRRCCVYTWREAEHPGIMAALSEDGGRSWDLEGQVRLWDATGRDRLGVVALDSYPRSHDTIAFGAPAALRLSNGDIYAAWWCMEAAIVHVRWARLKVVD